ncbi:MAG: TIGR01777 family oxidoreductase, partial [Caldilineaceae bacterium]
KEAGAAMMDALRQASVKPGVLVQASAVAYYGPRKDNAPVTEAAPPSADWLARVVYAWEASTAAAASLGVRRPVIRTGIVFSTAGGAFPKMKLPFDMVIGGGPLGSGKQYVPWIHMDDQVRAIRFLMENEKADGPFNLCAPGAVTYKEFAKAMGEVMGRTSIMPAPGFAIKAVLGDMAQILLTGQRQVPARLLEMGFTFNYPELKPALQALLKKQPKAA